MITYVVKESGLLLHESLFGLFLETCTWKELWWKSQKSRWQDPVCWHISFTAALWFCSFLCCLTSNHSFFTADRCVFSFMDNHFLNVKNTVSLFHPCRLVQICCLSVLNIFMFELWNQQRLTNRSVLLSVCLRWLQIN